jgi:hypothetical protein
VDLSSAPDLITCSKKLRLPSVNTEMFKVQLTAQLPAPDAAGGLLGRGLGLRLTFEPHRSYRQSVVCKAPEYSLDLSPRVGPPQILYDKIGFPGSVYLKVRCWQTWGMQRVARVPGWATSTPERAVITTSVRPDYKLLAPTSARGQPYPA